MRWNHTSVRYQLNSQQDIEVKNMKDDVFLSGGGNIETTLFVFIAEVMSFHLLFPSDQKMLR